MQFSYPHTIENGGSEILTFVRLAKDGDTDYLEIEGTVPRKGDGPPMHVHFKQDESFTVVKGRIGIQVMGNAPEYHNAGGTVLFKRGVAHKFWNAGDEPLHIKGWVKPAHNLEYFLTEIYRSTKENGGKRPGTFAAAYLTRCYKSEFAMYGIPSFVKNVIMPIALFFGKLQGKHQKFANAPDPVK